MLTADSDIQAWLDTTAAQVAPYAIVPYVRSGHDTTLRYEVQLQKEGLNGKSVLRQGGTVTIYSHQTVALGSMTVSRKADDTCSVTLTLYQNQATVGKFRFDCPKSDTSAQADSGAS